VDGNQAGEGAELLAVPEPGRVAHARGQRRAAKVGQHGSDRASPAGSTAPWWVSARLLGVGETRKAGCMSAIAAEPEEEPRRPRSHLLEPVPLAAVIAEVAGQLMAQPEAGEVPEAKR
jgi:hypothetical protein